MQQQPPQIEIEILENQLKEKTKEIEVAIYAGKVFEEVKEIYLEKKRIAEAISQFRQLQNVAK